MDIFIVLCLSGLSDFMAELRKKLKNKKFAADVIESTETSPR
jgi:hypothetical protein